MTYEEGLATLKGKTSRKIGNNTYMSLEEGIIRIRLHGTDVVTIYRDNSINLNSGGWRTVTTKDRMNKYLSPPWRVVQEKFEWYVWNWETKRKIPYYDHIILFA